MFNIKLETEKYSKWFNGFEHINAATDPIRGRLDKLANAVVAVVELIPFFGQAVSFVETLVMTKTHKVIPLNQDPNYKNKKLDYLSKLSDTAKFT